MRVLVIDDDPFVRSVIARMLCNLGVPQCEEAPDGLLGLRALESSSSPFDLVICDIAMPDADGMEFMRWMAERTFTSPLMILSSRPAPILASIEIMAKEYGLTVLSVVEKPLSIGMLNDVLGRCRTIARTKRAPSVAKYSAEEILGALARGEFEPFFQPKVEISTGRLRGCEALARWRHPTDGVVAPGEFLAAVEAAQRMDDLTWLMLEQAAAWCRSWQDAGRRLIVNLNLSMSSLSDTRLADRIEEKVLRSGIAPEYVVLEVTETAVMSDIPRCLESLCRLRLKGFGLSIDDFGTGFSSLEQLARVPYTELKIDRIFVNGVARSSQNRAVVEASIAMARRLGLDSVAEGVETAEDWECLHALRCDMAQGYFVTKPLSGAEFTKWARSWHCYM
jgi:EAL domain-containing protein (putative c-di-GMP-specific phosphodiesterase class I)